MGLPGRGSHTRENMSNQQRREQKGRGMHLRDTPSLLRETSY